MLLALFTTTHNIKMEHEIDLRLILSMIYHENNQTLFANFSDSGLQRLYPYYLKVVALGAASGEFKLDNPEGIAKQFLYMVMKTNEVFGRTLFSPNATHEKWQQVYNEVLAFEWISKQLFGLADDMLYTVKAFIKSSLAI